MSQKQKLKRVSFLLAVALVIAVIVEILFFLCERAVAGKGYATERFFSGDFTAVEYEKTAENHYTSLANDAYFEIRGIDFGPAQTIDLTMRRPADDGSEMVLRFTGRSGGVYGSFTVGIKRIEEGLYRAGCDYDSIDSIRIYPTEKNHTDIFFEGIEINSEIIYPEFSVWRIFLWIAIVLGIHRIVLLILSFRRKRELPLNWESVYFLANMAVTIFAYTALHIFWTAKQIGHILIPLAAVAFSAVYLFIYIVVEIVKTIPQKAFMLFLAAGIAFSFASAPLQIPDEGNHFARIYAISKGSFDFRGDFEYPDEVKRLYEIFPENLKMYQESENQPSALERMRLYLNKGRIAADSGRDVFSNSLLIPPYLPSALAVAAVRLFSPDPLPALYAARLINVVLVSFALLWALKQSVRNKVPIILTAFFPLAVFMSASASYDAVLIAAFLIFFGIISKETVTAKNIICLAAVFSLIILIKPLYLPLVFMVFLIPANSRSYRVPDYAVCGIMLAVALFFWQITVIYAKIASHDIVPSAVLTGVDKPAQVMFILKHPLRFLTVALVDGFRKSFYIGEYGLFGYLDLTAGLTTILVPVWLVLCSAVSYGDIKERRKRNTLLLAGLDLVMYLAVAAGFYVVDSSLGGSTILGVQARYFIPCIFIVSCMLANLFGNRIRIAAAGKAVPLALYSSFMVSAIAAGEVLAAYSIR